jgi:dTDP-glucose 4,6-dehydratase
LSPTRDFNYVKDTVEGFIAITQSDNSIGEVINIGTGYEISIGELAKTISRLMNADINIITDSQRLRPDKSEVERLMADSSKARRLLGWEPRYGGQEGLERGLAETIAWFTDHENLKKYRTDVYNI